eukprot:1318455-Alexandrium_andersonii.AAC.1
MGALPWMGGSPAICTSVSPCIRRSRAPQRFACPILAGSARFRDTLPRSALLGTLNSLGGSVEVERLCVRVRA